MADWLSLYKIRANYSLGGMELGIEKEQTIIGFIGIGVMGKSMARQLLKAGI